jgi:hypothetical protein
MSQAQKFLEYVMKNNSVQSEIAARPLSFEWVQTVAAKHGYIFTVDELNTVLAQSPELVDQLQSLIAESEIELNEAEMALIAGGESGGGECVSSPWQACAKPPI